MTEMTLQDGVRTVYQDRLTTVILPDGSKGFAKCSPDDEYNREFGKNMAYERAVKRSEKRMAKLQVKLNDRVTIIRNTENARVKGMSARAVQFINDDYIVVELDRKVPMVFSSPGALFRLIYSNRLKIAKTSVQKVLPKIKRGK